MNVEMKKSILKIEQQIPFATGEKEGAINIQIMMPSASRSGDQIKFLNHYTRKPIGVEEFEKLSTISTKIRMITKP